MQNCNLAETPDDNKGDYGIYDATGANSVQATPTHKQNTTVDPAAVPALNIGGGVYAGPNSGPNASGSSIGGVSGGEWPAMAVAPIHPSLPHLPGVLLTVILTAMFMAPLPQQIQEIMPKKLCNQPSPTYKYPTDPGRALSRDSSQLSPSRLSATSSPYAQQQQQSSSPRPPPFGGGSNRFSADYALEQNMHVSRSPNKHHLKWVNYSLSPGKSLTNPGSISPAMRQSTSSINPAAADP
uniref:Uncharacterized protein n=1 Tax=Ditylenchus dipsaci TaxID=166011 RepID=A0A915E125_9BILA